ncbi:hypothetical protein YB2330_000146 [Saitoella coloradoensis]
MSPQSFFRTDEMAAALAESINENQAMLKGKKPKAIDMSHHLSLLAKSRRNSPLKSIWPYMFIPGMIGLAGGLPHPDYFPYDQFSAQVQSSHHYTEVVIPTKASNPLLSFFRNTQKAESTADSDITIPKYSNGKSPIQLATALQYGQAQGLDYLLKFVKDFTARVYKPAYEDWDVIMCCGSTDALNKILMMVCERSDNFLCEEFTYPTAIETGFPMGISPVPVKMDGEGIIATSLKDVLSNWDDARGPRPRVLYTVPVGQNPTGSTIGRKRRQEVMEVCNKYDVLIIEDDPYYFLQMSQWQASDSLTPTTNTTNTTTAAADDSWIDTLSPSYLQFDTQGRVLRIDSFSKVIAPGSRCGWITSSPLFVERLLRASEVSTQQPSGFAQVLIGKLLVEEWGQQGWIEWLKGIRREYTKRRDQACQALEEEFRPKEVLRVGEGEEEYGYTSVWRESEEPLVTFVPPVGGMFVWCKVDIARHPQFESSTIYEKTGEVEVKGDGGVVLMDQLWQKLIDAKVLLVPGKFFAADESVLKERGGAGYFRLAFSSSSEEDMKEAVKRFGKVVREFFGEN